MILDLLIIGFIGWFTVRGLKRGLLLSLTGLVGFIVSAVAALMLYPVVSVPLRAFVADGPADLLAVVIVFTGVSVAFWFGGRALTKVLNWTKWGALNRAGGALVGAAWAVSWVTGLVLAISVLPAPNLVARSFDRSTLARNIAADAPGWARTAARTDIREVLDAVFGHKEQKVAIAATTDFARLPGAETQLFELINEERAIRGMTTLHWDEQIARAARAHSRDMYIRGYFSHRSPEGWTPGERLRAAGVRFAIAGENLALSPSVGIAHNRLMASGKHRAEILDPRFRRVGIGVMVGGQGLIVAQTFAG